MTSSSPPESRKTTIRALIDDCLELFTQCKLISGLSESQCSWLETYQSRLDYWSSFQVRSWSSDSFLLDYPISQRVEIRHAISVLLQGISAALNGFLNKPQPLGLRGQDIHESVKSSWKTLVSAELLLLELSTDHSKKAGSMTDKTYLVELHLDRLIALAGFIP